jgi:hypothetical protein
MLSEEESDEKKETEKANRNIKEDVEGYEGDGRLNEAIEKDTEGYEGDGRLSRRFDKLKRR